jgi:hypothetical protein
MTHLRAAVDAARDPSARVLIASFDPLPFDVAAEVLVDAPKYVPDDVLAAVADAITSAFAFDRRAFAQPVAASEVIAVSQEVPGVVGVRLTLLYVDGQPPSLNPVLAASPARLGDGGQRARAQAGAAPDRPRRGGLGQQDETAVNYDTDALMRLLPAVLRLRDADLGGPLQGLLGILAGQAQVVRDDIAGLYENWFIETCDEWVVPYIADLLGVRGLHPVGGSAFSQRARVANTLLYRQRKGTATMLEQLAADTTGWPARVLEFFQVLDTTQYANHRRPANFRAPDLRDVDRLELIGSPFETVAHTGEVRHIASNRGRYNIPNVGIFLWRLQSYFVPRGRARAVPAGDGRYHFDPLGSDAPLFNRPQTETEVTHLAEEVNVPGVLRRRPIYEELEARRQALVDGSDVSPLYFGDAPVLAVWLDGNPVDPSEITVCNLADPDPPVPEGWYRPPKQKTYRDAGGGGPFPRDIKVGVDPKLGRVALPAGDPAVPVEVAYAYGFSGDTAPGRSTAATCSGPGSTSPAGG